MGLMSFLGNAGAVGALGQAAQGVAEVFAPNATRAQDLSAEAHRAALAQFAAEFAPARIGRFDRLVDGLNRLPRPMLAFGTLGLFAYAMADPAGFAIRMRSLEPVPEPLWWLLGAIVGFYFGAREMHHFRIRATPAAAAAPAPALAAPAPVAGLPAAPPPEAARASDGNAALDDWRRSRAAAG